MITFVLASIAGAALYALVISRLESEVVEMPLDVLIRRVFSSSRPLLLLLFISLVLLVLILADDFLSTDSLLRPYLGILTGEKAAQAVLGLLFGPLVIQWTLYIIYPTKLARETVATAHRRWGFGLLALLAAGILLPELPRLLERSEGLDILLSHEYARHIGSLCP